ncbi:class I SAM-dependent methyltransferase [Streptomyces sp. NPDC046909]|uniref:class I SAM-dependent methyltransferase n=1 Tax=Streptomyces sp. NPDC046909 TaxID=3155617 RepID=UPI00340BEC1B
MHDRPGEALDALARPGMGTENAGPALRVLARMLRPRTVVEVGAGSSTLHLLLGLADARAEAAEDARIVRGATTAAERASVLHPRSALDAYEPRLLVVDDLSVAGTSAHQVWEAARELGLDDMITFIERDFFDLTGQELDAWGPLDLVWLDAGTQADDAGFLTSLWPRVPAGGTVVLHEPYLATTVETYGGPGETYGGPRGGRVACQVVPTPLLQELRRQAAAPDAGFDVLALAEPHKHRQTGLLLLRKHGTDERDRGVPFAEELEALGEDGSARAPLLAARPARPAADPTAILAALADDTRRAVHSALVLRPDTVPGIAERLDLAPHACATALTELAHAGLVACGAENRWSAVDDVWRRLAQPPGELREPREETLARTG